MSNVSRTIEIWGVGTQGPTDNSKDNPRPYGYNETTKVLWSEGKSC